MSPTALKRRRMSSSSESSISHRPIRPLPKRRQQVSSAPKIRPSLLLHRSSSALLSETETDTTGTSSTELGTALSDVESEVQTLRRWEDSPELMDGDEVEHSLIHHLGTRSSSADKGEDSDVWSGPDSPLPWRGLDKGKSIDPAEYGVARVLFPLEKVLSYAVDKSMDIDTFDGGILVGKGKQRQTSTPVTPPKRTREWEATLDMSDDDGDDELEVDELADVMPIRRTSRKRAKLGTPITLLSQPSTPSITNITSRIDNLAASSVSEIAEAAMSDAEDDAVVHASLVPRSPIQSAPSQPKRSKNAKKACLTARRQARQRAGPSRLTAAPCANSSRSYSSLFARASCSSGMDISDPETTSIVHRLQVRDTAVQRRPKHRTAPVRLPGQLSTSNLHRYSPTSLLPLREKGIRRKTFPQFAKPSRSVRYLFGDESKVRRDVTLGQAVLGALHVTRMEKQSRNALVRRYNSKHANGSWRDGIGKWFAHDLVTWHVRRIYLKFGIISLPEDEASVERALGDGDVTSATTPRSGSISDTGVETVERLGVEEIGSSSDSAAQALQHYSPMKRSGSHLTNAQVEVVSERWGRRNELRLHEETASHRAALRDRRAARRQRTQAAGAQNRTEEAARRDAAALTRREEEERLLREEAESQARLQAAEALQSVEVPSAVVEEDETPADIEEEMPTASESGSPHHSDLAVDEAQLLGSPPSYVSPPRADGSVRHRPFRAQRSPSPPPLPISPPRYRRNLAYSRRSPTPPPPYNATTDRQTLVAARFVEFSSDEEGDEDSLPPTPTPPARVFSVSTLPSRTRMVGAFPSVTSALSDADAPPTRFSHDTRRVIAPAPIRRAGMSGSVHHAVSAFEAAVDIEDGSVWQSDFESDDERVEHAATAFDEPSREDEEGGYAALGRLRRWIGRWMG